MVRCFTTVNDLVNFLCSDFVQYTNERLSMSSLMHIGLSGGNTPKVFLASLSKKEYDQQIQWNKIHFYWSDERCVPANHEESNYGMANEALFSKININKTNLHRIRGENEPFYEAGRYAAEIMNQLPAEANMPVFDLIFLGVGEDGHCASIFPDRTDLIHSSEICEAVTHPATGKWRITLTGGPLISARRLVYIVTGRSKSKVIGDILNNEPGAQGFPAFLVGSLNTHADWFLDEEAAKSLKISCRD